MSRLSKLKEKNNVHQQILEQFIETGNNALKTVPESSAQDATHPGHILEKRVHDLKLARMISLQMTPQIDLILSTSQTLVDKIQTSLLTTIPLWRSQMTIASALVRQKTAMDIEKISVDNAADHLASK